MPRRPKKRLPHVVVCVDNARSYGRGILLGIGDYVEKHGPWSTFVQGYSTGQIDGAWLRGWQGDGILAYIGSQDVADLVRRSGIPCVETYGVVTVRGLPHVGCDDVAIGRLGAEHLLNCGFRNLAFCGLSGIEWSENRYRGFATRVAESGSRCRRFRGYARRKAPAAWERLQKKLTAWLEGLPKPVGVMSDTDIHAVNIIDASRRAGIAVPDEIAVLGVDNDEEFCRLTSPPLSSIVNNARQIGYEAAKTLDQLMSGRIRHPERFEPVLIPPTSVITRQSTDVTAVDDPTIAMAITYIRSQACNGITVQDVASAVHRTRKTLYRRFTAVVGRSPHDEILRVQLNHAKTLLIQSSCKLDEIAHLSGFGNASYFCVAFKREVGMTPATYRTRHSWTQQGR